MSRTTPPPARVVLFRSLVDDAAVFPPGLAPLPEAVSSYLARRDTPRAAWVGPLLVPATASREVAALAAMDDRTHAAPLPIGLIARPDAPIEPVHDAIATLADDEFVLICGIEVGSGAPLRPILDIGVPVAIEVPAGVAGERSLDEVAELVDADDDVIAKFRTGATPTWPWPAEDTLAAFVHGTVGRGLAFKLTGGLHHLLRRRHNGEDMHGLLNVMVATHAALEGAAPDEVASILALTTGERLVETLATMSESDAERLRDTFTSFGCCDVSDPLDELVSLGLIEQE